MRATRYRSRGQAITEFALVLPVLIVILLYSMYFTELVRAKLKLQEASRYVAWEMTSYTLDDYANADHNKAFETARVASVNDAVAKFVDLDSIDDSPAGGFVAGYSNVKVKIEQQDAPLFTNPITPVNGNTFVNSVLGVLNGSAVVAYNHFKFNTKGKVGVEITMQLDNRLMPQHFLDENGGFFQADMFGGRNLQNLRLKNRFTLLASGWDLPDGADAEQHREGAGGPRAGVRRGGSDQGMYTQVQRMRLLGAPQQLGAIPGLNGLLNLIGDFIPNPLTATYVVSHNYFAAGERGIKDRGCSRYARHGAVWGMNNLQGEPDYDGPGIDYEQRSCFDTAPFRDTSNFSDSQYREMFLARGPYFMGCKKAQADNPSEPGAPEYSGKDKHNKKANCEGP